MCEHLDKLADEIMEAAVKYCKATRKKFSVSFDFIEVTDDRHDGRAFLVSGVEVVAEERAVR